MFDEQFSERTEVIERHLVDVLEREHASAWESVSALWNILTLSLATISCDQCRARAVEHLRDNLPEMARHANEMAIEGAESGLAVDGQPHMH